VGSDSEYRTLLQRCWHLTSSASHYSVSDAPNMHLVVSFYFLWRCDPTQVMASSFLMFLDHTKRRTTVGRTPLDEWSARRRDLYLTTHDTHNRQISMPPVQERLRLKLKLTPKITAVLTEHGMTKAYLHRFHLLEDAKCTCGNDYQSMDHILFHCDNTRQQRETMIRHIGEWPTSKKNLINKHQKIFYWFIESIDFDDMQQCAQ